MKPFDDREIREFLLCFEVSGPAPELVARTKHLMRQEVLQTAAIPEKQEKWMFMLVGMAVVMSLCLFYMFTVGTILRFVLPAYLLEYLHHTLFALTAVGGSLVACALMMFCFKQFYGRSAEGRLVNM